MHLMKCSKCGTEVERMGKIPIATCFNCKMERVRKNANRLHNLKK